MLNKDLIEKQKLSEDDVADLEQLHKHLDDIVHNPHNYTDPVALIENIEFVMQRLWKFEENRDMHTHWLRIKGCTCEQFISGRRYIKHSCIWHGGDFDKS